MRKAIVDVWPLTYYYTIKIMQYGRGSGRSSRETRMLLIRHHCPECDSTSSAPVSAIRAGDAGAWQCENCNQAFNICIEFRRVAQEDLQKNRDTYLSLDESDGAHHDELPSELAVSDLPQAEENERRLLEVRQEVIYLKQKIQTLQQEADQLRADSE